MDTRALCAEAGSRRFRGLLPSPFLPQHLQWRGGGDAAAVDPTGQEGEQDHRSEDQEEGQQLEAEGDLKNPAGDRSGGGDGQADADARGEQAEEGVFP